MAQTAGCDVSMSRVTSRWRRASVSSERFLLSFFSTLRHSTQKDWRKKAVFKETTAYFSSPSRGRFTARPYFRSFLLKESLAPYSYSAVRFSRYAYIPQKEVYKYEIFRTTFVQNLNRRLNSGIFQSVHKKFSPASHVEDVLH